MINLAIQILYLLIGIIVLCLVVWLALYVVKMFVGVPDLVEKAIWVIVLILILIGVLTLLAGGSLPFRGGKLGSDTTWSRTHLSELLGGYHATKIG